MLVDDMLVLNRVLYLVVKNWQLQRSFSLSIKPNYTEKLALNLGWVKYTPPYWKNVNLQNMTVCL